MRNGSVKQSKWKQHISDWKKSGQTQAAYCKEQGLKNGTFGYWRTRLNRLSQPEEPSGFIEMKPPKVKESRQVELKLSGGMCLCWTVQDFTEVARDLKDLSLL